MTMLAVSLSTACSSDDETPAVNSPNTLYAVIIPEGTQNGNITPSDYVLTLDNILAVNPETGEFKVKNSERIDSKAYHLPTQHLIQFYSGKSLLFEAKLSSSYSSMLPTGLTFEYFFTDINGSARYVLRVNRLVSEDGKVIEGDLTGQQKKGMQRMYEILQKAGKISSNIHYDYFLLFNDSQLKAKGYEENPQTLEGVWHLVRADFSFGGMYDVQPGEVTVFFNPDHTMQVVNQILNKEKIPFMDSGSYSYESISTETNKYDGTVKTKINLNGQQCTYWFKDGMMTLDFGMAYDAPGYFFKKLKLTN